jgi:hypothetical protein
MAMPVELASVSRVAGGFEALRRFLKSFIELAVGENPMHRQDLGHAGLRFMVSSSIQQRGAGCLHLG